MKHYFFKIVGSAVLLTIMFVVASSASGNPLDFGIYIKTPKSGDRFTAGGQLLVKFSFSQRFDKKNYIPKEPTIKEGLPVKIRFTLFAELKQEVLTYTWELPRRSKPPKAQYAFGIPLPSGLPESDQYVLKAEKGDLWGVSEIFTIFRITDIGADSSMPDFQLESVEADYSTLVVSVTNLSYFHFSGHVTFLVEWLGEPPSNLFEEPFEVTYCIGTVYGPLEEVLCYGASWPPGETRDFYLADLPPDPQECGGSVKVTVDPRNAIREYDETNNQVSGEIFWPKNRVEFVDAPYAYINIPSGRTYVSDGEKIDWSQVLYTPGSEDNFDCDGHGGCLHDPLPTPRFWLHVILRNCGNCEFANRSTYFAELIQKWECTRLGDTTRRYCINKNTWGLHDVYAEPGEVVNESFPVTVLNHETSTCEFQLGPLRLTFELIK